MKGHIQHKKLDAKNLEMGKDFEQWHSVLG